MATGFCFGASKSFVKLVETVDRYAVWDLPVLLQGETGVGKELVAERIHQRSNRARGRYLPINCAAIPPSLFESELFGYERGAFSGAVQSQKGAIRSAAGGTVFLDEVGEIPKWLQVKLLRTIETGEVRPIGGWRIEKVDVRYIAATNLDLRQAVMGGIFRADLYHRLSVLRLRIPPPTGAARGHRIDC